MASNGMSKQTKAKSTPKRLGASYDTTKCKKLKLSSEPIFLSLTSDNHRKTDDNDEYESVSFLTSSNPAKTDRRKAILENIEKTEKYINCNIFNCDDEDLIFEKEDNSIQEDCNRDDEYNKLDVNNELSLVENLHFDNWRPLLERDIYLGINETSNWFKELSVSKYTKKCKINNSETESLHKNKIIQLGNTIIKELKKEFILNSCIDDYLLLSRRFYEFDLVGDKMINVENKKRINFDLIFNECDKDSPLYSLLHEFFKYKKNEGESKTEECNKNLHLFFNAPKSMFWISFLESGFLFMEDAEVFEINMNKYIQAYESYKPIFPVLDKLQWIPKECTTVEKLILRCHSGFSLRAKRRPDDTVAISVNWTYFKNIVQMYNVNFMEIRDIEDDNIVHLTRYYDTTPNLKTWEQVDSHRALNSYKTYLTKCMTSGMTEFDYHAFTL